MKRLCIMSVLFFLFPILIFAQGGLKVKGTVLDTNGEPLIGANVFISALSVGSATDSDGLYEFEIPSSFVNGQQVLITAAYVGYKKQVESIVLRGNTLNLNFSLEEDIFESEVVVVTGIASRTSKAVAEVAVSRVSASDLTSVQSYQGLSQLVSGKISGVQMSTTSGNVGSGFRFYVRGGGGLNGNEQPVIYIDGIRIDDAEIEGYAVGGQGISLLANINVQDIESLEILKGPAASAMYGTSGSNGVVLITTKSGKLVAGTASSTNVDYRYNYGINQQSFYYSREEINTANLANSIYKEGLIRENFISVSGGTGILRYYTSFENRIEDGILDNSSMDRKSFRVNVNAYPTENLSIQAKAGYVYNFIQRPNNDNNIYGYLGNTLLAPWVFTDSASVANISDKNNNNQFLGSLNINWKPLDDFEINAGAGVDDSDWRNDQLFPRNFSYGTIARGSKAIFNRQNRQFTYDFNARYNYNIIEGLKATSIIGTQILDNRFRTSFARVENFGSQYIMDIGSGGTIKGYGEGFGHSREAGIFFENSFSYQDQYFLTLGIRKDYASTVGREAPSIEYPKASFAVRLDKYDFIPKDIFSLLKLRAAYGVTGTLPAGDDPIQWLWGSNNGGHGIGGILFSIGNPNIKPESIKEIELGFDTEFLSIFSLEFTFYNQFAKNSIVNYANPPSSGKTASNVPYNVGSMENSGIEILFRATPIRTRDYGLDLALIWNYQTNKVTSLGEKGLPIYDDFDVNVIKEGLRKHEFYAFKSIGATYDSLGIYDVPLVSAERVDLGNPVPDHTGSFTVNFRFLKNFNLYALTEWGLNNKIYNNTKIFAIQFGNVPRYNELANLVWGGGLTPGTPEYRAAAEEFAKMDYTLDGNFVEDADFFILRELSLSYDMTDLLIANDFNSVIKNMSVGFSARNVWKSSLYSGADIEVNFDGGRSLSRGQDFLTLQNPRTVNFWVKVGF